MEDQIKIRRLEIPAEQWFPGVLSSSYLDTSAISHSELARPFVVDLADGYRVLRDIEIRATDGALILRVEVPQTASRKPVTLGIKPDYGAAWYQRFWDDFATTDLRMSFRYNTYGTLMRKKG